MIRVLIVDDHPVVRDGLRGVIEGEPDLTVVGEAGDGAEALARVADGSTVDVVLMDLRMPRMGGVDAIRELQRCAPSVRILVLTTFDTDSNLQQSLLAGAAGFLLKDAPADQLVAAIRAAAAGDAVLAPSVVRRLVRDLGPSRPAAPEAMETLDALTERERDVLVLMADGCSNAEIGERLHVTEGTVKTHVANLYGKLEVSRRTQAVAKARDLQLIA